jgi:growth hormone-inducible transmembrane protein
MILGRLVTFQLQPLKTATLMPFRSGFPVRSKTTVRERLTRSGAFKQQASEAIRKPATETPFVMGKAALATGAAVGIGALCFYGLRASRGDSALDRFQAGMWSQTVKERIHSTYAYFGGSLAFTAASAVTAFRSPTIMRLFAQGGWMAAIGSMVAVMGLGMATMSTPYPENGLGLKHLLWVLHSSAIGIFVAPVCIIGGPLVMRAALYTAGIVGGMSALAMCAPSEQFLYMGAPLGIGLGVVLVSSLGSMFLSPATALGAGLYSISLYGGLLLFSGFLVYDTQKIIHRAENHPDPRMGYAVRSFDPINNSIGIYMDTINIFIRIASMLAGGGNRKR